MRMTLHADRHPEDTRAPAAQQASVPLVIELEGALLPVDIRSEAVAATLCSHGPRAAWKALRSAPEASTLPDPAHLPYRPEILSLIANARTAGRPVYLLTTSSTSLAPAVAAHLPLFDGIIDIADTDSSTAIRRAIGDTAYDIAASTPGSRDAMAAARQSYAVDLDRKALSQLRAGGTEPLAFSMRRGLDLKAILRLLRPHQYAKNALVMVPLLTSHQLSLASLTHALLAFLAFCFAASAVYVLNDAVDIEADRAHPTKRLRPFAAGTVPLKTGLSLIPLLLVSSALLASGLPLLFSGLLAGYMVLTTAYSFVLKRLMLVDVTVLSLLYTLRVIAGAAAITVPVSEWLFAFALLMFTALALTKRYVELSTRLDRDLPDPANRDYKISDLPIIAALAAAAGMNAITVLALYVNSANVTRLYAHPSVLWLLCPLFLYWTSRTLLLAHRRQLHDDPILFALRDRLSWLVGALSLVIVLLAM